jgi:futalosine hydrolase
VFVPTELERTRLRDCGGLGGRPEELHVCGFGPVAAAAGAALALAGGRFPRALLLGIAGSFDPQRHPSGTALEFSVVALDGVGVGTLESFRPPSALGFPQWPARAATGDVPLLEHIGLARRAELGPPALLLTTCAASADPAQAAWRRARFPAAAAEDMEGFAVATACALAGVPLRIVRGISNVVGDRDPGRWRIPAALNAARALALELLADESGWEEREAWLARAFAPCAP